MPGIAGVMQAQYNLLLHLDEHPDAHSLRIVMDSQRVVSHEAAARIADVDPGLAVRWTARKETYVNLVAETRDLGGLLGKGNAAGHGSIGASRAQKLTDEPFADTMLLRQLDRLFAHIDERVCAHVEHGVMKRLYLIRVPFPRVDDLSAGLIKAPGHRYIPITSPAQTDLIAIARRELRPAPIKSTAPKGATQNRADFEAAVNHRPRPGTAIGT